MLACECYDLQILTPWLMLYCVLSATWCDTVKYCEREGGTYSSHQPQYSHTCHLKEYNRYSNYSVRMKILMSSRITNINACTSLEILVPVFPSFWAWLIKVLWYFSYGCFSSYQYVVFRSGYLINWKYNFDLKFIHAALFQLNKIISKLAVIGSRTCLWLTDNCLQTEVWNQGQL
jgi:hypothetical protein